MSNVKAEVAGFTVVEINKAIEALDRAQRNATSSIAKVLVMAVYCSIVGVDAPTPNGKNDAEIAKAKVAVANTLMKFLRKSIKRDAIVGFLEHYGQLAFVGQTFVHFTANEASKALKWTSEYVETVKLAAQDWESFRKPTIEAELDVETAVQAIITKVAKAQKSNKSVKNAKLVVELQAALAKFHAAQV